MTRKARHARNVEGEARLALYPSPAELSVLSAGSA